VYEIFHETGTSAECEKRVECQERWTTSTNKGIEVLPRFGFLACATAFEAVVQDTIKRCLETVFSTRKVSKDEKESWMPEFTNWLKSRIEESEFWNEKEHEEETRFWTEFLTFDVKSCETTKEKQNQNQTLLKLKKTHSWKKVAADFFLLPEMLTLWVRRNNVTDDRHRRTARAIRRT